RLEQSTVTSAQLAAVDTLPAFVQLAISAVNLRNRIYRCYEAHDLACGGRHVRIYTGADAREHRRAQRRRLLHARHADREPQHVGHDALPKLSLRRTAGENRTVDRFAGYLFDDAEVAERDVRRRFLDRPDALL